MAQELAPVLRRSETLSPQELEISAVQANALNTPLLDFLLDERHVAEDALANAFHESLNIPWVRLDVVHIEPAAVKLLTSRLVRKHTCLPLRLSGRQLVLAMANPLDYHAIQDVQFASSRQVQPVVACRTEILASIEEHYPSAAPPAADASASRDDAPASTVFEGDGFDRDLDDREPLTSPPAVELCSRIVLDAIRLQASDIHIEPGAREVRIRLRVDGVLRDYCQVPRWMHAALVSRVKVLAKLDIAQQRVPQDGRIKVKTRDCSVDLRVSILPTHFGEKVVLRLLGSAGPPQLSALGFSDGEMALLDDALSQPQGLVLVTGPTGAGKSTTLYSMLTRRESVEVNVVTIEDPIEYHLPAASQVSVDVKAGVTFAGALRAVLRQDPDIIMVGEIRDAETAKIAFQAALTGHLVLSTLHTNGSVAAVERLLDLGVKPLMITAATNVIVAQRLARRVCGNCREPYVPSPDTLRRLRIERGDQGFQHGRGCAACGQTGYAGRIGIFEILRLTPRLKDLVRCRAPEAEIRQAAVVGGTRFLLDDALHKMRLGLTTPEEILRVIRIEDDDLNAPNRASASPLEIAERDRQDE